MARICLEQRRVKYVYVAHAAALIEVQSGKGLCDLLRLPELLQAVPLSALQFLLHQETLRCRRNNLHAVPILALPCC